MTWNRLYSITGLSHKSNWINVATYSTLLFDFLFIDPFHIQIHIYIYSYISYRIPPLSSTAMHRFSAASLGVLALISPALATANALSQASPSKPGTTLRPINIADYEASMGLQRRDSNDLSLLNPQNQSELVYGSFDRQSFCPSLSVISS